MDETYFRRLLTSNPQFFLRILGLSVKRMQSSNLQIELLALRTLKERIASLFYTWGAGQNPAGAVSFRLSPYASGACDDAWHIERVCHEGGEGDG